jgi:creatinine deaminase
MGGAVIMLDPARIKVGINQKEAFMDPFLQAAIAEAEAGLSEGGIPIGSVLVYRGAILGRGHNRRVQRGSVILHGEMDAVENAGRHPASVYRDSVLYTTLSPCAMCSGTILLYGIPQVVIGENQTFRGEEDLLKSRGVKLTVLQSDRCIDLMRSFIQNNPELWNEDIGT